MQWTSTCSRRWCSGPWIIPALIILLLNKRGIGWIGNQYTAGQSSWWKMALKRPAHYPSSELLIKKCVRARILSSESGFLQVLINEDEGQQSRYWLRDALWSEKTSTTQKAVNNKRNLHPLMAHRFLHAHEFRWSASRCWRNIMKNLSPSDGCPGSSTQEDETCHSHRPLAGHHIHWLNHLGMTSRRSIRLDYIGSILAGALGNCEQMPLACGSAISIQGMQHDVLSSALLRQHPPMLS